MAIKIYSYGNIARILFQDTNIFENSIMVDVNLDERRILSLFDAKKKFDADFIRSYLNILRESKVGFRLLTDSEEDAALRTNAFSILESHGYKYPEIKRLLSILSI